MRRCDFSLNGTRGPVPFEEEFTPPHGFFQTIGSERDNQNLRHYKDFP